METFAITIRRCAIPCYEINTISLELKASDKDLLMEAMKTCGFTDIRINQDKTMISFGYQYGRSAVVDMRKGTIDLREGDNKYVNQLKQSYSLKAIETVAKRKKWILKQQGNKIVAKKY